MENPEKNPGLSRMCGNPVVSTQTVPTSPRLITSCTMLTPGESSELF